MPTSGYQVGIDTNDVVVTYGMETTWGTIPSPADGQICRMNSEGFSKSKTRNRPGEINTTGQVSKAVTTGVSTKGDLKVSISAGSHFDLVCASIMGVADTAVSFSAKTTVAATASGFTDSGTGFVTGNVHAGDWIRVTGFTGAQEAVAATRINGYYQVLTVAAGTITTFPVPGSTKAAGDSVTFTGNKVKNGTNFQSAYFQKKLASNKFLCYPGSFPTGGTVSANNGGYFEGSVNFMCKDEVKGVSDAFTGTVTAANTNDVIDTVNGFSTLYRGAAAIAATVTKVDLNWSQNAREQRGMGSAATLGIGKGLLEVKGTVEVYFSDFTLYDEFINETASMFSFKALDLNGSGYIYTLGNATIMNPKIVAGGPGQDIMASFELEGNPTPTGSIFGGSTIQIDKVT